jgi:carbon monoxide dehydrogenase subunit G
MTRFSKTVEIRASPQRVWTVLRDVGRWDEWTPTVTSIERLDGGPLSVGSRVRIRQPRLPPAEWRVTALEEGKSFTSVTGSSVVRVTARHWVEPAAAGSRATLSIQFSGFLGPIVGWLTRGLNKHYLGLEARGLKGRSEDPKFRANVADLRR